MNTRHLCNLKFLIVLISGAGCLVGCCFVINHLPKLFLYLFNVELKWSEYSRLVHRFDTSSHHTITNKFTKFYILLNVIKFNRYLFPSLKGSITSSLLQNKTCVSTSKSQPPTRPDPTQNCRAAASAAVFSGYPYVKWCFSMR
jgi:hypothetical protein